MANYYLCKIIGNPNLFLLKTQNKSLKLFQDNTKQKINYIIYSSIKPINNKTYIIEYNNIMLLNLSYLRYLLSSKKLSEQLKAQEYNQLVYPDNKMAEIYLNFSVVTPLSELKIPINNGEGEEIEVFEFCKNWKTPKSTKPNINLESFKKLLDGYLCFWT